MYFTLTASQLHLFWNPFSSFIRPGTISQVCAKNMVMTLILWHNPVIWGGWNTSIQLSILSWAARRHKSRWHTTWKKKKNSQSLKAPPKHGRNAHSGDISLKLHPVRPPRLNRLMERCHSEFHQLLKAVALVSPNLCWNNGNMFSGIWKCPKIALKPRMSHNPPLRWGYTMLGLWPAISGNLPTYSQRSPPPGYIL